MHEGFSLYGIQAVIIFCAANRLILCLCFYSSSHGTIGADSLRFTCFSAGKIKPRFTADEDEETGPAPITQDVQDFMRQAVDLWQMARVKYPYKIPTGPLAQPPSMRPTAESR
jgi:hypothetical protein